MKEGEILINTIFVILQFFISAIIATYFLSLILSQKNSQKAIEDESRIELEKLNKLEKISLTEPLCEKTRPKNLNDIIGQKEPVKALIAALCGPNPQHVIIYGPPGVGKTAAARLILERAKITDGSPFKQDAKFIETDATTLQFDERSIADPLIGSVHDPIYQGSGAYGNAGIPQPKKGAVSNAHGGVLFIDEIGELHPIQINRLLKVLEDRKVKFESAYYARGDKNIPAHIHKIFRDGMPADFRLVGATTKSPDEIPPAIRTRCVEIYFNPLNEKDIEIIAKNAAKNGGFELEEGVCNLIAKYADNGRDAVNIIQTAISVATSDKRTKIHIKDAEWVLEVGKYQPRFVKKCSDKPQTGIAYGLSVTDFSHGYLMEIEASAKKCDKKGKINVSGMVDQEQIDTRRQKLIKKSSAKESLDNAITVMKNIIGINTDKYDIHINFPGGIPVDGPSAGIALICAMYSAINKTEIEKGIALTGEISILGNVKAVGGVVNKIIAAKDAGIKKVIIPKENYQQCFEDFGIEIIGVSSIFEVIDICFNNKRGIFLENIKNVSVMSAKKPD
ncbi:MAG: ATP-dependent protease LonB [Ruminococcaceae bacterium]|nr:ATP-dependent protease LonB [Oscillospiraceae bacterium]